MARTLRGKLTYSNVVATLALFLVVSGGAAYAASHLGKNSVGAKQLKKNAVTTAKVKNQAVTAAKVKKGTLTGTQINASTLGTVPTAQTANTLAAPESWHEVGAPGEPAFQNGWKDTPNLGGQPEPVAFYKDQGGVVHLRGWAVSGSGVVFQLPPGYRPATSREQEFVVPCFSCAPGSGDLTVLGSGYDPADDGAVVAPGNPVGLDGVTFRAES